MLLQFHSRLEDSLSGDATCKGVEVVLLNADRFFESHECEQVGLGGDEAWCALVRVLRRDVTCDGATFDDGEVAILSQNEKRTSFEN